MRLIVVVALLLACDKDRANTPGPQPTGSATAVPSGSATLPSPPPTDAAASALAVAVPSSPLEQAGEFNAATPLVSVTPSEIVFAKTSVLALSAGAAVLTDMPKLTLAVKAEALTEVNVAFDASIPYRTVHAVISALASAKVATIRMVIKVADAPRTIQVAPFSGPDRPAFAQQVFTVTPTKAVEWNWTDGRSKPKASYSMPTAIGMLRRDYAEAHRNLGSVPSEPPLIIEGDDAITADLVVQVALAARLLAPNLLLEIVRKSE